VLDKLKLSITCDSKLIASVSETGITIREFPGAFKNPVIRDVTITPFKNVIFHLWPKKRNSIPDEYGETEVIFKGNFGIRAASL